MLGLVLAPGARLAHFVIQRQLGAGGMGVVYEATDETLGRKVAVKVLPPELVGSAERRQRFLREARSAAAMSHPNIATVFEIDEADGQVFIVMELVGGESLRDLLSQGRLPITRALDIALGVTRAAEHAHAAGVVHRDLKPENVMVIPGDQVKVLDFGVAKPDADPALSNTLPASGGPITEEGRVLGTPGYMAPEQARGERVDGRADVFSIGVVLYEMVTGVRPFQGGSSMDIIVATTRDEPAPVTSHNPGAPRVVERLLRRCLAKEPAERFASAGELAKAIEAAVQEASAHELATTQAMPAPFASKPPPVQSTPAPAAPAPPATTAATALPARTVESAPRRGSVGKLVVIALVFAATSFAVSKAVRGKRARANTRPPAASAAVVLTEPRLGLETLARYANETSSTSALSPGEWDTAALDFERAAKQAGAPPRWTAAQLLSLGMRDLAHGKLAGASEALRGSIAADPSFALPHVGLSSLLIREGKPDEAVREAQTAQTLAPDMVAGVAAAGRAYAAANRHTDAIEQLRRAVQRSPLPGLRAQLALAYHQARMDEAAGREAELVLKEDADNALAHLLLAERALEANDAKGAFSHTERAVAVEPRNSAAWLAHGDALLLLGRGQEAKTALAEAVRLWSETKQAGAPAGRMQLVKQALDAGKLPASRGAGTGRSSPPPRSLPAPAPRTKLDQALD